MNKLIIKENNSYIVSQINWYIIFPIFRNSFENIFMHAYSDFSD